MDLSKVNFDKIKNQHNHSIIRCKDIILRVSEYEKDFSVFSPLTYVTRDLKDEQRPCDFDNLNWFFEGSCGAPQSGWRP